MLTVKAKHATMLLTVSEVEGLSDGMEELSDEELPSAVATIAAKQLPHTHPSVVMVSGKALFWTHHAETHTYLYKHISDTWCVCMFSLFLLLCLCPDQ